MCVSLLAFSIFLCSLSFYFPYRSTSGLDFGVCLGHCLQVSLGRVCSIPLPPPTSLYLSLTSLLVQARSGFLLSLLSGVSRRPLLFLLDNRNVGGGGIDKALDLAKALQDSGSVRCWSNSRYLFIYLFNRHFWYRNKEQQEKTPLLLSMYFSMALDFIFLCHPVPYPQSPQATHPPSF